MSTLAMIPAREGSQRLQYKNLALIDGEPMLKHIINSAKDAGVFDDIYVNSDSEVFGRIAESNNVEFYHRKKRLGSSDTKSDEVVYDFVQSHNCDTVAWVNPVSPLQPASEIREVIEHFNRSESDSLITVSEEQVHGVYDDCPINFSEDGLFEKTQDLKPINLFAYSIMMWDVDIFIQEFEKNGYAMLCGNTDYYPVSDISTIKVKTADDLLLVDAIARGRSTRIESSIKYHELVEDFN